MKTFLGTGWSFPPTFFRSEQGVMMVSDEEDIKQSLEILLHTELGERIMQSDFGCSLEPYMYETINARVSTLIKDRIREAILNHESRIDLDTINLVQDQNEGTILINISYTIRQTNSRSNYVFPYYIKEGTYVR